jgi:hypothetical protein
MASDQDRPIARIRQVRRVGTARDRPVSPPVDTQTARLEALEARLTELERLAEGLQDSVHREAERHATLIAELQTQVRPDAMRAALAKHARDRGL